ncbi:NADP-dependent 3-hydroxy acid dehydrogenase YdfG [Bradyrhizobium sp. USDA 326]
MALDLLDRDSAPGGTSAPDVALCPFHGDRSRAQSGELKTLVLTGASRGIGHATGKLFSEAGRRIITCSRQKFDTGRCPWDAGTDNHVQVELSDHRALPRAVAEIKERLNGGRLHALINNAGISPKTADGTRMNSLTTPVETWMSVFHVNLLAPVLFAQSLVDELRRAAGAIVNVTSIVGSGVHPLAGTAYATSKAVLAPDPRDGARLRAVRNSRQCDRARRDQDRRACASGPGPTRSRSP